MLTTAPDFVFMFALVSLGHLELLVTISQILACTGARLAATEIGKLQIATALRCAQPTHSQITSP